MIAWEPTRCQRTPSVWEPCRRPPGHSGTCSPYPDLEPVWDEVPSAHSRVRDRLAVFWTGFRRALVKVPTDKDAWFLTLALWIYFAWLTRATGH